MPNHASDDAYGESRPTGGRLRGTAALDLSTGEPWRGRFRAATGLAPTISIVPGVIWQSAPRVTPAAARPDPTRRRHRNQQVSTRPGNSGLDELARATLSCDGTRWVPVETAN